MNKANQLNTLERTTSDKEIAEMAELQAKIMKVKMRKS